MLGAVKTPRQNALGGDAVTVNWMFQLMLQSLSRKFKETTNQKQRRIFPLNRVLLSFGLDDLSNNNHSVLVPKKPSASILTNDVRSDNHSFPSFLSDLHLLIQQAGDRHRAYLTRLMTGDDMEGSGG